MGGETERIVPGARPSGRHAVLAACLILGMSPLVSLLAAVIATLVSASLQVSYVVAEIIAAALMSAICWAVARRQSIPMQGTDAPGLLTGVVTCACFYPASMLVSEVAGLVFPSDGLAGSLSPVTGSMPLWLAWVVLALLPAVSEEFLCRGVVFGAFRVYGPVAAVLASSIGFACMHGSAQQFAYTLFAGLTWACLREATGSVAPCVLAHMAFNTMGVAAMASTQQGHAVQQASGFFHSYAALAILAILAAAAGASVLVLAWRRYGSQDDGSRPRIGKWALLGVALACAANVAMNVFLAYV